ncbi:ABC transporter permease [Acaryochloris marina]|uniref:ABC transporter permease n=1 Tax=Acaryochloris marina TaxID=155978 RepID=UPI0021C2A03D|nr:ABC transporter permease [Acaryochloris marina]BDM81638.1 glycine/betaine ABC transporter permease [Acaryochloris marina MBIC10699]
MVLIDASRYAASHQEQVMEAIQQHLLLVSVPLGFALLIGGYGGWRCVCWSRQHSTTLPLVLLNVFNGLRVIPSLAILFLLIPILGLTFQAAAFALWLLAIPPILLATEVGFRTVPASAREVGLAMGMTRWQLFSQVDLPLALPVILSGIKTATLEVIASATLAAFIGAGGLGSFITLGFALNEPAILLVGAIPVAGLALLAEGLLNRLQQFLRLHA